MFVLRKEKKEEEMGGRFARFISFVPTLKLLSELTFLSNPTNMPVYT